MKTTRRQFIRTTASTVALFNVITSYSGAQRGGKLGQDDVVLTDVNGETHLFRFETFFNGHEALSLGVWIRPRYRAGDLHR